MFKILAKISSLKKLHGDKLGNPGLFKLKLTKAKQGEMPRLIATDGSGVVNGKEKNPVRPVKPRYPVSPVSLYPISRYDII